MKRYKTTVIIAKNIVLTTHSSFVNVSLNVIIAKIIGTIDIKIKMFDINYYKIKLTQDIQEIANVMPAKTTHVGAYTYSLPPKIMEPIDKITGIKNNKIKDNIFINYKIKGFKSGCISLRIIFLVSALRFGLPFSS